jgi:hypothetical protein
MNPALTPASFCKINFILSFFVHQSFFLPGFSKIFHFSHTCYLFRPSHPPFFVSLILMKVADSEVPLAIVSCFLFMLYLCLDILYGGPVGIRTGYGLEGQGSIPGRGRVFSLLHSIQTSSGTHPTSYPISTT